MNPKEIILNVLEIIGYSDDREKFANEFLGLILQKSINNLAEKLPQNKLDQLRQRLSLSKPEKLETLLKDYFSGEELNESVKKVSENMFKEYLEEVGPTLSNSQKEDLQKYLTSL
ncbi:MAG: hypothetical protein KBD51_02730 [Candidatus Levybacteria bacterium]|nr:hypothetical protein [Candidatus Levybacteria bacterium]